MGGTKYKTNQRNFSLNFFKGLNIPCIAEGDPNPEVHWSRRGATAVHRCLAFSTDKLTLILLITDNLTLINRMALPGDPSVLELQAVTREDSGEYICQVGVRSFFTVTFFRQGIGSAPRRCLFTWQSILRLV